MIRLSHQLFSKARLVLPSELRHSLRMQPWRALPLSARKTALLDFKRALDQDLEIEALLVEHLGMCFADAQYQRQEAVRIMQELMEVCPGSDFYSGRTIRVPVGLVCVDTSVVDVLSNLAAVLIPAACSGAGTLLLASPFTYSITSRLLHLLEMSTSHQVASHVYPLADHIFEHDQLGHFYCMESQESSRKIFKKLASLNNCMAESFFQISSSNPVYLCEDHLPEDLSSVLRQSIRLSGQSLKLPKRLILHKSRPEAMQAVQEFIASLSATPLSGKEAVLSRPMSAQVLESVKKMASQAAKEGLICFGGQPLGTEQDSPISPLVVTGCKNSAAWQQDLMGPVLLVDFAENDEEAVRMMDGAQTNSWAAVFTQDRERAVSIGDRVVAGQILVNSVEAAFNLPMGGRRRGARGNMFGQDAFHNTVICKSVFK